MKKFFFPLAILPVFFSGCIVQNVKGSGDIITKTFPAANFTDIDASGSFQLQITQGNEYAIKVDCDDNLFDYLQIFTQENELIIKQKNNTSISPTQKIKVYITSPKYNNIECSGRCILISKDTIKNDKLKISMSGSSDIYLLLATRLIDIDMSGQTNITLKGTTDNMNIEGSGSTQIHAYGFIAKNIHTELSGSSDAELNATSGLNVDVSGAANVSYKGDPIVQKSVSGAASINKVE